jgi:hypothetical protein
MLRPKGDQLAQHMHHLQTSEQEMLRKEHGGQENKDASDEILYKIDIPANRYDMLCLEGIARALNIFNRTIEVPQYKVANITGELMHQIKFPDNCASMHSDLTQVQSPVLHHADPAQSDGHTGSDTHNEHDTCHFTYAHHCLHA